jgi:hypothetical protein
LLRIIAADSGAATLNEHYEPLQVVAACAVLVEPPYIEASSCLAEPIFVPVEDGYQLVVHELELCVNLLKTTKADLVHLDMTLGGLSLEDLSAVTLSGLNLSSKAKGHLLKVMPKLRKLALDIRQAYDIDVSAIGKESIPVRVAELTSGAHAVVYTAQKAIKEAKTIRLGLPARCSVKAIPDKVILESLLPAEEDVKGHAEDKDQALQKVGIAEMPNPRARGFRLLEVVPKG